MSIAVWNTLEHMADGHDTASEGAGPSGASRQATGQFAPILRLRPRPIRRAEPHQRGTNPKVPRCGHGDVGPCVRPPPWRAAIPRDNVTARQWTAAAVPQTHAGATPTPNNSGERKQLMAMLETGAVLGIDVGFSDRSPSTAFCLLRWDDTAVRLRLIRTKASTADRRRALDDLLAVELPPLTVALDGPLARGLGRVRHYRSAEALLSQGVFQKRGKPGQTSSPTGLLLHEHATLLAKLVLQAESEGMCRIAAAGHYESIHEKAIVEAFPNQFLAALLPEADLPPLRRDASDRYWEACVALGLFGDLFDYLLPGRAFETPLSAYGNHDDRAAIVCAMTGLCVAAGRAVGVGDSTDGDIMLPPRECWGVATHGDEPWLARALRSSLTKVRKRHPRGSASRVVCSGHPWPLDPTDGD